MANTVRTPWENHMDGVPMHLEYPQGSMYEAVEAIAEKYPQAVAFDFMGSSVTYQQMLREIRRCCAGLRTLGFRAGECFTIALPNCPQAIYMLYAVNLAGGSAT